MSLESWKVKICSKMGFLWLFYLTGRGKSKKLAKRNAAINLLNILKSNANGDEANEVEWKQSDIEAQKNHLVRQLFNLKKTSHEATFQFKKPSREATFQFKKPSPEATFQFKKPSPEATFQFKKPSREATFQFKKKHLVRQLLNLKKNILWGNF